ncbi:MAG: FtsQ-type POTRA domain-containing protein [Candidatus Nanopelagicales bacterium]|nr:FtsQ-type POTRA domain-containing protein [Candidatus Nanopelagicales bacterium]
MSEPEVSPTANDGVVDLDARRVVTPKKRRRTLITIFIVIVALAAGWVVWFSSLLTSESVSVIGVEGAPAEQIAQAAQVPLGVPLAQLDTQGIADQLVSIPWLASVDVRRGWPHDVVIAVVPRTAIAVTGSGLGVDAKGVEFAPTTKLSAKLPTVTGDGIGLVSAMGVLNSLPDDLRPKVAKLSATTRDNVELTLHSGAIVKWGSVEQAELKSQVTRALLKRKAKIYDVSAPELPTTFKEKVKR